jgi:hypothetical protein
MARPETASSVALSSIGSMSVSSGASSLSGGQLQALVQRRSILRTQLAQVEQHLAVLPPSTAGASTQPHGQACHVSVGPSSSRAQPLTLVPPHTPLRTTQAAVAPRDPAGRGTAASRQQAAVRHAPTQHEEALPGAMRTGYYAFWPKHLPGATASKGARIAAATRQRMQLVAAAQAKKS